MGDIEGGEEDCFEHCIGYVGIHMPCWQCDGVFVSHHDHGHGMAWVWRKSSEDAYQYYSSSPLLVIYGYFTINTV